MRNQDIKMAKVIAGESAVVERLRAKGLLPEEGSGLGGDKTESTTVGAVRDKSVTDAPERVWVMAGDHGSHLTGFREKPESWTSYEYVRADLL